MRCPFCGEPDSQVKDSRPTDDGGTIRRRRQCEGCAARFTTFERVQLRELAVMKRDGTREAFDRDKLQRSIAIACRKRAVDPARLDRLASGIQRQLETSGEAEVNASRIGALVMEGLKALDSVAYIRFASVYKEFTEPADFQEFAGAVSEAGSAEGQTALFPVVAEAPSRAGSKTKP